MHFLLWTKRPHENTNFDIFKCSDENLLNSSCHFPDHKLVFLPILHDSSVSWNFLLCTFLGQTLYTLHERDQSKGKFFRLFSAQVKIHQILVIFETKNKLLFRFFTTLIVHIVVSTTLPSKTPPPSFLPILPYKSTNCSSPPLYFGFSWTLLKVRSFSEPPKY